VNGYLNNDIDSLTCTDVGCFICTLSDVDCGGGLPSGGDVLIFDNITDLWILIPLPPGPPGPPGNMTDLCAIPDVNCGAGPDEGDMIIYDNSTGLWIIIPSGNLTIDMLCQIPDVDCGSGPEEGDFIVYDNITDTWVLFPKTNLTIEELCEIPDVDCGAGPLEDDMVIFDNSTGTWILINKDNLTLSELCGIPDVDCGAGPLEDDMVIFDNSTGLWMLIPKGNLTIDALCELPDVDCGSGPEEGDILVYDNTTNLWMLESKNLCNCTNLIVETFSFPNVSGAPCICGDPGCDYNTIWFCDTDGQFYFCDALSDTWIGVGPPLSLDGEQDSPCDFGNNPINDTGCSVAWGADVGTDAAVIGLFMYTDFTIFHWGVSIDDQSECLTGFYNVMVCWSSGPLVDDDYDLANCTYVATNQTSDASSGLNLRVEVPGNRFIIWGLENFCNDEGGQSIIDWNVHLLVKYRAANP